MVINQSNQNPNNSDREALKELNGMAKALMVSFAWSWGEVYEENLRKKAQQKMDAEARKSEQNSEKQVNDY